MHLIQCAENKGIGIILYLFLGQSSRIILETDKLIQIWYWGLYAKKSIFGFRWFSNDPFYLKYKSIFYQFS